MGRRPKAKLKLDVTEVEGYTPPASFPYSLNEYQQAAADAILSGQYRYAHLLGSVGSGKTFTLAYILLNFLKRHDSIRYLVLGQSQASIVGTVGAEVMHLSPFITGTTPKVERPSGRIEFRIGQNVIAFAGASTTKDATRIQGYNTGGLVVDETVNLNQHTVNQAIQRNRDPRVGRQFAIFASNPGHPASWYKEMYDKAVEDERDFTLALPYRSNTTLDDEYYDDVESRLPPAEVQRYVNNEWAAVEPMVYPHFTITDLDPPDYREDSRAGQLVHIPLSHWGVDWGPAGTTVALKIVPVPGTNKWVVVDEYVHNAQTQGVITQDQHVTAMISKLGQPASIRVDKRATLLIKALQDSTAIRAVTSAAHDDINLGIERVKAGFERDELLIHQRCQYTISNIRSYTWQVTPTGFTLDKPKDEYDHAADALRYIMLQLLQPDTGMALISQPPVTNGVYAL